MHTCNLWEIKSQAEDRKSPLIRKIWNIAWDIGWYMWNYRNHNLYASDLPTKAVVLTHVNTRISYHFNFGTIGLATRCHFLFKKKEHIILYIPIRQKLGCLVAIYSA